MRFEIHYLAVFRSGCDPALTIPALLRQVYEDETDETPDEEFIIARWRIRLMHQREDGQVVLSFTFSDDREDAEAQAIHSAFGKLLSNDSAVEHVLKFQDSFQLSRYQQYAREIYELEMRLREAISFIFIDGYGGSYYDLLKDSSAKIVVKNPPSENDYKSHHENEFFYLVFDQYIKVNERKPITQVQDLISFIGRATDLATLQTTLTAKPIENRPHSDFLARIKGWIDAVEKLRNCIAHNRTASPKVIEDYESARPKLMEAIAEFFNAIRAPSPPS